MWKSSLLYLIFDLGIRAGSGNVMLYGPAGTGKTIMCQAAAFEANAELIIGIMQYFDCLSSPFLATNHLSSNHPNSAHTYVYKYICIYYHVPSCSI